MFSVSVFIPESQPMDYSNDKHKVNGHRTQKSDVCSIFAEGQI